MRYRWTAGVITGLILMTTAMVMAKGKANVGRVRGTPHDLAGRFPGVDSEDTCAFCHTSHVALRAGPLWNIRGEPRSYRTYESRTEVTPAGQPDGDSSLCLSCHDGLVAPTVRRLSRRDSSTTSARLPRIQRGLGSDLSNDHPVSIPYGYATAYINRGLVSPDSAPSGLGGTVAEDLLDEQGKLQCTSCHDAHGNALGNFLVRTLEDDTLCRQCHSMKQYDFSAHAGVKEAGLGGKEGCTTCHTSHGAAPDTPLLREPEMLLCSKCHREQFQRLRSASSGHGRSSRMGSAQIRPMSCGTCHNPHVVQARTAYERRFLTDPRDPGVIPRLIPTEEAPRNALEEPYQAAKNNPSFCLICHDGSWAGAANILGELRNQETRGTEFSIGTRNLHYTHTSAEPGQGTGCTYCHDVHGANGPVGVQRDGSFYPWLTIREFPYRGQRSCGGSDPLSKCH